MSVNEQIFSISMHLAAVLTNGIFLVNTVHRINLLFGHSILV